MANELKWADELTCAVTVCDREGVVIYQNAKARLTFEKYGDLIGKNLKDCHGEKSWIKIQELMKSEKTNTYTIEKAGVKMLIYQSPWFVEGAVKGMVEFSIELPAEMPHFIR